MMINGNHRLRKKEVQASGGKGAGALIFTVSQNILTPALWDPKNLVIDTMALDDLG
jgi:hypothetical protein